MTEEQEQQLIRESGRGAQAAQLLESSIYKDAMSRVEAGIMDAWKSSPVRDVEGQQYLRLMMKCLADLQGHIKDAAQTGKLASVQLERERSISQRMKDAAKGMLRAA